jgi:hypothetical protein
MQTFLSLLAISAGIIAAPLIAFREAHTSLLLSSVGILAVTLAAIRNKGLFNPVTLFIVTAAPYSLAGAVDILTYGNSINFNIDSISALTWYCLAFLVTFYFAADFRIKTHSNLLIKPKSRHKLANPALVLLACTNALVVYLNFGFDIGSLSRAEIYSSKSVFYDIFKLISQSSIIYFLWDALINRKQAPKQIAPAILALASIIVIDVVIVGDRRMATVLLLILGYFYTINKPISRVHWLMIGVGSALLFAAGLFRNLSAESWIYVYDNLELTRVANPANQEFGAFAKVWNDVYHGGDVVHQLTYAEAFLQIIPSAIFPDRPIPPSVQYVRQFHPEIFALGGGMAFNAILESIINFSVIGPFLIAVLLGSVFDRHASKSPPHILRNGILIYAFCFTLRNDLATTLRFTIICSVAVSTLLFLTNRIGVSRARIR